MPGWHTYEDYREAYAAHRAYGGGVLLAQIHDMDYLYWFFGLPRKIFALGGHLSSLESDVEDVASTLMQCEREGSRFPVHLHQDYLQRPARRGCEIIGDSGKIETDLLRLTVKAYDASVRLRSLMNFTIFSATNDLSRKPGASWPLSKAAIRPL